MISPGYRMQVGAQAAAVFDSDECPPPEEDQHRCIVIEPETKTVSVLVALKDGLAPEIWTVEHSGDNTMLRRADGSYLAETK